MLKTIASLVISPWTVWSVGLAVAWLVGAFSTWPS